MSFKRFSSPPKINRSIWAGLVLTPVLVVLAALAASIGGGASAGAVSGSVSSPDANAVMKSPVKQSFASVRAYWTPERMAAAQPMAIKEVAEHSDQTSGEPVGPTGPPVAIPGRLPSGAVSAPAGTAGTAAFEPDHQSYHVIPPYDLWQYFAKYRRLWISTVSKMFFTQYGTNYVCSAGVVKVDGAWTAGHCVHAGDGSPNGWSYNVMICPSYDSSQGGVNPAVGCWGADNLVTLTDFYNNGNDPRYEADMGGVNTSNTGTHHATQIGNITGWAGFAYNFPRDEHWTSFGYPAGSPFTGGKIITAASEYGYDDDSNSGYADPHSVSMGNDMTGGSSGGPWFKDFGTGWYINGHNDWRHTAFPNEMNSPYFDGRAFAVYGAF